MPPGLSVVLNDEELVTVSTESLNIVNVRVHGDRVSPEFANVEISGGLYGEEKDQKHLIWEDERPIFPGDEIMVALLENASTSRPGKTINQLYPEDREPHGPWQPIEQLFHNLAQRPIVRQQFAFTISPPSGPEIRAMTGRDEYSFAFSVTWVWLHPERARVSLSSNTLDSIAKRQGGTYHAEFRLLHAQQVKFRVDV